MQYYFVLCLVLVLGTKFNFSKYLINERKTVAPYFILFFFSGLRVDAGYDYGSYVQLIEKGYFFLIFEPISITIALLASYFKFTQLFFIITALILVYSIYDFTKEEGNRLIFLLLYFSLPFCFLDSFSLVRQFLAMSFILLAYKRGETNKLAALTLYILAIFSHNTAIAAVLMIFPLSLKTIRSESLVYFAIPIIIITSILIFYVVPYIPLFNRAGTSVIGLKGLLLWVSLYTPCVLVLHIYTRKYNDNVSVIAIIGIAIYIGLGLYGYYVSRFFLYFAPFAALHVARTFKIALPGVALPLAVIISLVNTSLLLFGARNNLEFDFLNNYKLYPSECANCDIRPSADF